ncbi:MAG: type VI secretion system tip protein VgrG, partial [Sulfurimonas sp.]|nr:type VI secretion system tip protein VgrG [Sulfurimonas sp.]
HKKLPKMDKLPYRPASGLQDFKQQAVSSIVYRSNNTVKSVRMKNYNYEKPSLEINSATPSSKDDFTQTYLFGNNLSSQDEAKKLSDINTQKYLCLAKEMSGESNIISITPACIYTLSDYFRDDLNSDYLMVRMESEGSQRGFLSTGFAEGEDDSSYYQNSFMMIPSDTQFRMQTSTQWPHIGGMISATIDGQGSGDTAEIDKDGRYKVIMPFDVSGRKDAKASAYMRMAQPSAGEKQGMHFPLHKGTEVLIAFKGGDPDQPIITGAVPNVNNPSPVNDQNATKSVIQTHGGNTIHMEDTPGKAHIKMAVHDDISSIVIHNEEEGPIDSEPGKWGIALKTKSGYKLLSQEFSAETGGNKTEVVVGTKEELTVGAVADIKLGEFFDLTVLLKQDITIAGVLDIKVAGGWDIATKGVKVITPEHTEFKALEKKVADNRTAILISSDEIADNKTAVEENTTLVATEKQSLIDTELKAIQDRVTAVEQQLVVADSMVLQALNMVIIGDEDMNIGAPDINIVAGVMDIDIAGVMDIAAGGVMGVEASAINIAGEIVMVE